MHLFGLQLIYNSVAKSVSSATPQRSICYLFNSCKKKKNQEWAISTRPSAKSHQILVYTKIHRLRVPTKTQISPACIETFGRLTTGFINQTVTGVTNQDGRARLLKTEDWREKGKEREESAAGKGWQERGKGETERTKKVWKAWKSENAIQWNTKLTAMGRRLVPSRHVAYRWIRKGQDMLSEYLHTWKATFTLKAIC